MYKTLRLASDIIFRNKLISLLIAFQLAFLSFFTLDNANSLQEILYSEKVLSGCTSENFAYFSPIRYDMYSLMSASKMESESDPYKCFEELSDFLGAGNVYKLCNDTTYTELDVYPRLLSEKLNIPMRKGKWISAFNGETENGYIPCVTSRTDRKIGETIHFVDDDGKCDVLLEVVGIAADPYFEFDQNVAGEELAFSSIVNQRQRTEIDIYGIEILWADADSLVSRLNEDEAPAMSRLLFFDNASPESVRLNTETLKKTGSVLNSDTSYDNVRKQYFVKENLPQILSVWCISAVGFCCTLIIFYYKCGYIFTVYSACGADKKLKFFGFFTSAFIIIILSVIPVGALLVIAGIMNLFEWTYSFIVYGGRILAAIFGIYVLLAAVISLILFYNKKAVKSDD